MTVLPADHRADLQKLEKIAGEPASLETEGALTPTPSGSTIVAASRSSKTWRSRCIPSSEPELQVKRIGVQCGWGLPLYRARIIFFSCRQVELEDLERWGATDKSRALLPQRGQRTLRRLLHPPITRG
jgi:hypothetical protein